jgi:hypothetical protein
VEVLLRLIEVGNIAIDDLKTILAIAEDGLAPDLKLADLAPFRFRSGSRTDRIVSQGSDCWKTG